MKKNIVYVLLILLLIGTIIYGVVDRLSVEKDLKNVEIVLDYNAFNEMARDSEHDIIWWFDFLSESGVKAVSVEEESIKSLIKEGNALESTMLMNLKNDAFWFERYPQSFVDYINQEDYDNSDVVILSADKELKNFILNGLKNKYEESFYKVFEENNKFAILLDGQKDDVLYNKKHKLFNEKGKGFREVSEPISSKLEYYKLGFSEEKISNVKKSKLKLNLRASNNKLFPKKQLQYYKNMLSKYNIKEDYMIFTGKEVLSYPHIDELKEYMQEHNIIPALIETQVQRSNIDQRGLNELVEKMDYQAVRVLPIVPYIQERFKYYGYKGAEEVENVIFRGVIERNIRLIYFRPFLYNKRVYVTDPNEYKISFERLKNRLLKHNIEMTGISTMKNHFNSIYYPLLISIGILGLITFIFKLLFDFKNIYGYLFIVLGSVFVFVALKVSMRLSLILLSLGTAIISGFIGSIVISIYAKNILIRKTDYSFTKITIRNILFTISMALIPLISGLIIASVLSGSDYLLEITFYRGVKLSEMLPLLLFVISYVLILGFNRDISELKHGMKLKDIVDMLTANVKLFHMILGAIAAVALIVYVARSGHESGIEPMRLEILFRNLMETKLIARPRLKEFLIAIPSLMILSYSAYRGIKAFIFVFSFASMITFTSIVNTFCHLRTPLYISIARTFIGLGFGIIIGVILTGILEIIVRLINKIKSKKELELR